MSIKNIYLQAAFLIGIVATIAFSGVAGFASSDKGQAVLNVDLPNQGGPFVCISTVDQPISPDVPVSLEARSNYTINLYGVSLGEAAGQDCNSIQSFEGANLAATETFWIHSDATTTITLADDGNGAYFIVSNDIPEALPGGSLEVILSPDNQKTSDLPTMCLVDDKHEAVIGEPLQLNTSYDVNSGVVYTVYLYNQGEGPSDCNNFSSYNNATSWRAVTVNSEQKTTLYLEFISDTGDWYILDSVEYEILKDRNETESGSEATVKPITTPRTGGYDIAKEAILVLFGGVSLGAIYLSLKPIKE